LFPVLSRFGRGSLLDESFAKGSAYKRKGRKPLYFSAARLGPASGFVSCPYFHILSPASRAACQYRGQLMRRMVIMILAQL
jgi:hypothetical protein